MPTLSMLSVLIVSTNILTNEYKIIYEKKIISFFLFSPFFFCINNIVISTNMFKIDSYKNVGGNYSYVLYSNGLSVYGIYSFQGKFVGNPNASELKKLPQRPNICPVINPKENKSAILKKFSL